MTFRSQECELGAERGQEEAEGVLWTGRLSHVHRPVTDQL